MRAIFFLAILTCSLLIGCSSQEPKGTIILGGGGFDRTCLNLLKVHAPGKVIFIPTAAPDEQINEGAILERMTNLGFDAEILHTRSREQANTPKFADRILEADGVWILGGRHWRLTDAYLGTRVHSNLKTLYEKGGMVGGNSAGATVLGSFMIRGDTRGNHILIGDHTKGFGLLDRTVIDQHVLARGRHNDLGVVLDSVQSHIGFGIDENCTLVVRDGKLKVHGSSKTTVWDGTGDPYFLLGPGDTYNTKTRTRQK